MASFYDPTSDVQTQWSSTGAAHYTEIDEGIRWPNQPTLADYLDTKVNNKIDEWGFPAVTGSPETIIARIYAETESKSTIVVSLQQNGVERATITIPISSPKGWYPCKWANPSGDLSTLTIEVKQVQQGSGGGTFAYVYAAYLWAGPSLDTQVGASSDDAAESGGSVTLDGASISLLAVDWWAGFRWTGVNIPSGATIDVCYSEFYLPDDNDDFDTGKDLYFEDGNNPGTFTTGANNISGRARTTAFASMDDSYPGGVGWYTSEYCPSLVDPLQEVVTDNAGTGDAVVLIIWSTSTADFEIQAWDGDSALAAKLHIEYTAGGAEVTKTHTLDAILKGTISKTHTLDALIQATETLNHTLDAILQSTLTKTHTLDAILSGAVSKAHTLDAILQATEEITHTLDAILQATETESHTLDAVLKATLTKAHTLDAILRTTPTRDHTLDAILKATTTKSHTLDAILEAAGIVTKTHTLDAILQAAITKTHTLDALLQATITKAHTLDAILQATVTKDHTLDAVLKATTTKTHALDALLQQTLTKTHTLDAILQSTFTKAHTLDAILKETITKTHTLDAILGAVQTYTKTYTLDAFLISALSAGPYMQASLLEGPAVTGIKEMIPEASAELEKKPEIKRTKVL